MTCLIVDDNAMVRIALRGMVESVDFLEFAGECADAHEAYNFLHQNPVDLIFLDVEMPGMTGLELVQSLSDPPLIILVTSKKDYAVEGFDLRVVDYLVKPVAFPRFLAAVEHARSLYLLKNPPVTAPLSDKDFLFARVGTQLVRIDYEKILFVQALGDYAVIVTPGKKYPVHLTLKNLEEKLPAAMFARVHRSYIVALNKIENMEDNTLLIGKEVIPVAESLKQSFLKKLNVL